MIHRSDLHGIFPRACRRAGVELLTDRTGSPLMWRDRWWQMVDRDPVETWVHGRIALLGDAAHPPLQCVAPGAIMAIEDGWVLAEHAARPTGGGGLPHWEAVLAA